MLSFVVIISLLAIAPSCFSFALAFPEGLSVASTAKIVLPQDTVLNLIDPSLSKPVFVGFDEGTKAHGLNFHWAFIHTDTAQSGAVWMLQGQSFLAWETQQPFTVPMFQLGTPTASDYVYMIGPDAATPPTLSGFVVVGIMAWVYDSPICGSVPLMSAVFESESDHYYTIDADEHAHLLSSGWVDGGVVAFVLALPTS